MDKYQKKTILAVCLLTVAVLSIGIGCYRGELHVVLGKAVTVCLECIGLG